MLLLWTHSDDNFVHVKKCVESFRWRSVETKDSAVEAEMDFSVRSAGRTGGEKLPLCCFRCCWFFWVLSDALKSHSHAEISGLDPQETSMRSFSSPSKSLTLVAAKLNRYIIKSKRNRKKSIVRRWSAGGAGRNPLFLEKLRGRETGAAGISSWSCGGAQRRSLSLLERCQNALLLQPSLMPVHQTAASMVFIKASPPIKAAARRGTHLWSRWFRPAAGRLRWRRRCSSSPHACPLPPLYINKIFPLPPEEIHLCSPTGCQELHLQLISRKKQRVNKQLLLFSEQ